MKTNIKKGVLALGTLTTVVAPIAAIVSCGSSDQNTINWNDGDTYGGVNAKEFLQEIKHLGKTNQNAIKVAREQMMQQQYESESIKSLKAQEDQFKYEAWVNEKIDTAKLENDKTKAEKEKTDLENADGSLIDDSASTKTLHDGYVSQIKSLEDSIKTKEDRLKELKGFITKLETALVGVTITDSYIKATDATKAFFKNDYNATDYKVVYKPLDTIREEKTNIVNDAYRQFYPQFTTRREGDEAWPTELAKNYGDAATFAQAIDYLVTNEISIKAFSAYKFEINKGFSVQQQLWAKYIDKTSFTFLTNAHYDEKLDDDVKAIETDTPTEQAIVDNILKVKNGEAINDKVLSAETLTSNVMFIGSTSPNHDFDESILDLGHVVKYQHMLIKAVQGATPDEVWTIKTEDLTKLVTFQNTKDGVKFGAEMLTENIFDPDNTDLTDVILKNVSGNSAGTTSIQGSLGIKSELEYLKSMVPGFSLGALAITEGQRESKDVVHLKDGRKTKTVASVKLSRKTKTVASVKLSRKTKTAISTKIPTLSLKALSEALLNAIKDEVKNGHVAIPDTVEATDIDRVNLEITDTLKTLGEDKVKSIFGRVFRDFFESLGTNGQKLVYRVSEQSDEYLVISQFGFHIIKRTPYSTQEKLAAALEQDMKNMAKDSSLSSSTSITAELNSVFTDTKIMEKLLLNENYKKDLKDKLVEYNKDKTDEVDKVDLVTIEKLIEQTEKNKVKTKIDEALGTKLETWLTGKADAGLRDMSGLTLDAIYGWVKAAGGDE